MHADGTWTARICGTSRVSCRYPFGYVTLADSEIPSADQDSRLLRSVVLQRGDRLTALLRDLSPADYACIGLDLNKIF
jgi:hypothetical protein